MLYSWSKLAALAASIVPQVIALAPTDSYRDADVAQSGYLINHNMDPAIVDSPQFGQLWTKSFNAKEQFYAKPLTYTPSTGGPQLLFLASSQNIIRTLNAKTGDLITQRAVHNAFLQSEIGCPDIPNTIGIIGTPTIDPATDIVYFFSKTYIANYRTVGATGVYNGVYYFHGVNINTLADVPGYPILIDGSTSDNRPAAHFIGGTVLQRPSLVQIGNYVYGAFGGHCDLYNYTGLVIGIDIAAKTIATSFAVESGPLVPQTNIWNNNGDGGQGGIWMSGMGLSSDGNRLFFVSGNGVGHENAGTPASGSSGCKTLGEAAVNLGIDGTGKLSLTDYFQPYDYIGLDGGDQDFGSGGIVLLDSGTFKGTGVTKMAVTVGKSGKVYFLNANNLGGYKLGPGQTDGIIQTFVTNKPVFGAAGSYPGEGGYVYITPIQNPTYVYKLGFSGSGGPVFSQVGATTEISAGRIGVGIPTITSLNGKVGSAILWMCDPDAGLRAWYAVPQPDNTLKRINIPAVGGLNKFQRPVFGDTRLYVTDPNGVLYCLGSPVNLPLTCTSPVDFGDVALGSTATKTVSCTANIGITSISAVSVGDANFVVKKTDLPQGAIAQGATFTFPVTWDLTGTVVSNQPNASYGNTAPGVKSTALTLTTVNAVAGYSTQFPIGLTGNEVSQKAFLVLAPITVDFGGLVILDPKNPPSNSLPFTMSNAGLSPLTISGYAYTQGSLNNNPAYTNVSFAGGAPYSFNDGFTSSNLPTVGTVIQGGGQVSVQASFNPVHGVGSYKSYLTVFTNGGSDSLLFEGSASTAPIANFSISTSEGGWLPPGNLVMDFGNVAPGSTSSRKIRICNVGGSVLQITKSKPPNGIFRPDDPNALHEAQEIVVGDCAYATVLFIANAEGPNIPDQFYELSWTLNTDDLSFGVHIVDIRGTIVSQKVGPTNSTGNPVYTYLGCYSDNQPGGRLLPDQQYSDANNNNGRCQTACLGKGTVFAGTEYQSECYCGSTPPPDTAKAAEVQCNYACSGDTTQDCGGPGGYINIYYDATRYTPGSGGGTTTPPATSGPVVVQTAGLFSYLGCYTEGTQGRALSALQNPQGVAGATLTVETCAAACKAYTYMGVEYSGECYCDNAFGVGSVLATGTTPATNGCNMVCNGNKTEYCGGPNRLNAYKLTNVGGPTPPASTSTGPTPPVSTSSVSTPPAATTPSVPQTVGKYVFQGCYSEATGKRALSDAAFFSTTLMTIEMCATNCQAYTYFGTEYASECYCGNTLNAGSVKVPQQTDCNFLCPGNKLEYCGAGNRLDMYMIPAAAPAVKMALFRPFNAIVAVGSENATSSTHMQSIMVASAGTAGSNGSMTVPLSTTATGKNATTTSTPTGTELTNMFASSTKTSSNTTITDAPTKSGLTKIFSSSTITSENSTTTSHSMTGTSSVSQSSSISKVSSMSTNSTSVTSTSTSTSTYETSSAAHSTTSEPATTSYNSTESPTSHSSTKTSTTTTTSSMAATYTPEAGKEVNGWTYLGCSNTTSPARALPAASNSGKNMTVEACQKFCSGSTNNYGLAGLQNGQDCYCGNGLQNYAALGAKGCDSACSGNKTEFCGGNSTLSVYNLTSSTVPPTTVKQVGYYLSQGCYPASISANQQSTSLLSSDHTFSNKTGMTVEACVEYCSDANLPVAGLEGGYSCTCAKSVPASAKTVDLSKCNLPCMGNSREFCGAYELVNVYETDASSVSGDGEAKTCNENNTVEFQKNGTKPVKRTERQLRGGRSEKLW